MIRCTACGTSNLDTSQFCDECGSPLQTVNQTVVEPAETVLTDSQRLSNVTSVGVPFAITEPKPPAVAPVIAMVETLAEKIDAKLVIERGTSVGSEFSIAEKEAIIGRWDADNGIFPDIDLDVFDPEAKVSRRHARIVYDAGKFMIEDLGSTNGTFVNRGRRLIPGSPQILANNDEIIVGKTFLRFHIN